MGVFKAKPNFYEGTSNRNNQLYLEDFIFHQLTQLATLRNFLELDTFLFDNLNNFADIIYHTSGYRYPSLQDAVPLIKIGDDFSRPEFEFLYTSNPKDKAKLLGTNKEWLEESLLTYTTILKLIKDHGIGNNNS